MMPKSMLDKMKQPGVKKVKVPTVPKKSVKIPKKSGKK